MQTRLKRDIFTVYKVHALFATLSCPVTTHYLLSGKHHYRVFYPRASLGCYNEAFIAVVPPLYIHTACMIHMSNVQPSGSNCALQSCKRVTSVSSVCPELGLNSDELSLPSHRRRHMLSGKRIERYCLKWREERLSCFLRWLYHTSWWSAYHDRRILTSVDLLCSGMLTETDSGLSAQGSIDQLMLREDEAEIKWVHLDILVRNQ